MFQVKICGITSVDDARWARDAGADAIGLNFFPPSPRCIERDLAHRIVEAVGGQLLVVGVFVNAPLAEMEDLADTLPLHFIQLHGDEPAESLSHLSPRNIIRAFRLREGDETSITSYLARCSRLGTMPSASLIDAFKQGIYGGTGIIGNWGIMRKLKILDKEILRVLAGGLRPDNVEQAIREARPDAVDVAGGVESSPGRKDPSQMRAFMEAARRGWREVETGEDA